MSSDASPVYTTKILFVCSGNTCRSPMAEYYANWLFAKLGKPWCAASAGISALRGMGMSMGACEVLTDRGYADFEAAARHVSAPAEESAVAAAELIVGMTTYHAEILKKEFPQHAPRIRVMPEPVSDPWGGNTDDYLRCLDSIIRGVDMIVSELKR